MMRGLTRLIAALFFVIQVATVYAIDLPPLHARVNDYAGVLTEAQRQALEASLAKIETYEGHPQVVILTTKDMRGMSLEQYSISVARAWRLGQQKLNNGLLITTFVAPGKDFGVRLEVGYGLEGIIPDATARAIYERTMRPHFRREGREDYMAAYTGAIGAIDALLRKELTGDPSIDQAVSIEEQNQTLSQIVTVGAMLAVFAGYIHWLGSGVIGSLTGGALCLTLGFSWWAFILLPVVGFFVAIFVHLVGRLFLQGVVSSHNRHGGFGGGGGGFSGGGGSFGGGGYSGGR